MPRRLLSRNASASWEVGLSPWDVAAGLLLIREAGGHTSDMQSGKDVFGTGTVVAGNEYIHKALIEVVNRPIPGK